MPQSVSQRLYTVAPAEPHGLQEDLKTALAELPPLGRQIYLRHRLEGWGPDDLARALGITPAMAEHHLAQALLQLARRLQVHAR